MNTVTQTTLHFQALINYANKYGVTKAAIRYKTNRQYIYRWTRRYDGTLKSLADKSHRPHHHPNQHTEHEIKLIMDMRKRNMNSGLVVFWVKLRQRGYTRSITGLYRFLRKHGQIPIKPPNPKYIPKPYEKMLFPGQRVQVDVKFVPTLLVTTVKLNVLIEKIMNTFMSLILSIILMTLNAHLLFTTGNIIISLCALSIGFLLLILFPLLSFMVRSSNFVTHH